MEFVDLPLCQREYQDLAMAEALINPGDVLLISGNAVKSLGDYNVEFSGSGVRQQRIDATPVHDFSTAYGIIRVGADDRPALALRPVTAEAQLIFDARLALRC